MKDKDRPLIGMNTDFRVPTKHACPLSQVQSGYYDSILTSGGLPVLVPPLTREADLNPILDRLDGFVLVGGDDLDPKRMGLGHHQSVRPIPERRETSDRLLCKLISQRKMPILAIGLGMQELNVHHGGALFVHLPDDMPRAIPHFDPQGGAHRHIVVMEPGSLMEDIYGPGEVRVSSQHHQGVRRLAANFRPAAHSPDGLLEAYESKDEDWFAIGVQWHPENDGHISLDTQLLEAFVLAAARARPSQSIAGKLSLAKAG